MCEASDGPAVPTSQLVAEFDANGYKALRALAENCPACILAALRQSTAWSQSDPFNGDEPFDFKKESALFWNKVNSAKREFY